jgi:hypothetical protein
MRMSGGASELGIATVRVRRSVGILLHVFGLRRPATRTRRSFCLGSETLILLPTGSTAAFWPGDELLAGLEVSRRGKQLFAVEIDELLGFPPGRRASAGRQ